MACASEHEWKDQVFVPMTLTQVRNIIGGDGDVNPEGAPDKPGLYAVDWPCCPNWLPAGRDCRGWFDIQTNRLTDKNIVNQ